MPYIAQQRRRQINVGKRPATSGELNYAISKLAHQFVHSSMALTGRAEPNYEMLNATYGAMMGAAAEFYRTVLAPYEDKKRFENGAVSPLDPTFVPEEG